MDNPDYDWNIEQDKKQIQDAIEDIDRRITEFEESQQEQDDGNEQEPLWPSISNRD